MVFKLDPAGSLSVLHTFDGADGSGPGSLTFDSQGNLYGTTQQGGNGAACLSDGGCGTVFELSPNGNGSWTETVLYNFCSLDNCVDGEFSHAGLVRDASGNLYGTTYFGGAYRNCGGDACGVVFRLDPTGKETVLHSFSGGAGGEVPYGGLVRDSAGNLYGTTEAAAT